MNMQSTTTIRQTKNTSFGSKLAQGLQATANVVGGAASMAIPNLPGGNVISAALSGAKGSIGSSSSALTAGNANAAPVGAAGSGAGSLTTGGVGTAQGALPGVGGANTGGSSVDGAFAQSKKMFEMQAGFNLQFLDLQTKMQNESRQFQTMSNVIKNRSDTAKNSIRNIN
tara:strand:+ start:7735 stop:8244 length:510 start_codon:yes stop_codon:yes gene_type:complete